MLKSALSVLILCSFTSCSSCSKEKFKVPKEPETAKRILKAASDEDLSNILRELEAKNDKRYVGLQQVIEDQLVLLGWDILKQDGVVDYVTLRHYEFKDVNGVNQLICPDNPRVYFVDFKGSAQGDINRMYMFEDKDEDGDTEDKEFVLLNEPLE